jgi:hypothetical protein
MRKLSAAVICIMLFGSVIAMGQPGRAAAADSGTESAFVAQINRLRADHGLAPLKVYGELVGVARGWADQMAAAGNISHNERYSDMVSAPWVKLGENVGMGQSVDSLMRAFINSPGHYRNLVDPAFNYIGVGVTFAADGEMFTTHDFMSMPDDAPPPEAAPVADPAPAPAPAPDPGPAPSRRNAPGADAASAPDPAGAAPVAPPAPVAPAAPMRVLAVLADLRLVDQ